VQGHFYDDFSRTFPAIPTRLSKSSSWPRLPASLRFSSDRPVDRIGRAGSGAAGDDGPAVLYVQLAKALESGDLRTPFYDMALNVYPVILVGLHRLGLELVHPAALPSTRSDIYVLVRSDKNRHVAQVPRPSK